MRRFLALLLIVLLPLQSAWAAAADVSGVHGTPSAPSEHGLAAPAHHEHCDGVAGPGGIDDASTVPHLECGHGHCHGHFTAMPTAWASTPSFASRTFAAPHTAPECPEPTPSRPERPQWPARA
jgi:hypothetical protein